MDFSLPMTPYKPATSDHSTTPRAWQLIQAELKNILSPQEYQTWIAPLQASSLSDHELLVTAPNVVFYQGIIENFCDRIDQAKSQLKLDQILIRYEVEGEEDQDLLYDEEPKRLQDSSLATPPSEAKQRLLSKMSQSAHQQPGATQQSGEITAYDHHTALSPQAFAEAAKRVQKAHENEADATEKSRQQNHTVSRALSTKLNLNPNYLFANFVQGESNQFAHATSLAVADKPGQAYNPLFIYGSTGLGKSHLLHAIGWSILENNPNCRILCVSSERFVNELIYCLRFQKMWEFHRKYRECDVFLVDDIQFIRNKDRTQEEFFHTFNALYEAKKQIVITSDLFPQDIPNIEERLRNRFQWGLIADIQPPSIEHRVAILMNKADQFGIHLTEEVAYYIAHHVKKNVRELEGALRRINAFAAFHGRPMDLELASETFQNFLGDAPKQLTIDSILKTVAEHYKLRVTDLKSKKRQRALTIPRQVAMYLARNKTNCSFPEIGTKFGGKDHTTVMHAVKKIEQARQHDLELKTSIEALERKLEQIN